jgi:HlyD family secretion protein
MNRLQEQKPAGPGDELQEMLARGGGTGWFARYRRWLVPVTVLIVGVLAYIYFSSGGEGKATRFRTEPAVMGNLVVQVSATGNLQPTNQVDVGSELSGIIEAVYVEENDRVKKGQELAVLDLSKLNDAVNRSKANLQVARAQVQQVQATVAENKANVSRLRHVAKLSGGKVPSQTEMDTAVANLKRAEANEASAKANVVQARAALQSDETNIQKAHIRSPIDGVVLARKVEPGQTVAASFQAPVLFTIAEDLTKMELQVDVDEADVGQVKVGQKATFTVDAWPGRQYHAVITEVGFGSKVVDGVVSYPAKLQVNNDDLSLRPGMTATAEITTLVRDNVLLVPNAALRFTPPKPPAQEEEKRSNGSVLRSLFPRPRHERTVETSAPVQGTSRDIWVLRNGKPEAVKVRVGPSDGKMTEITGGDLKAGMDVITEVMVSGQT